MNARPMLSKFFRAIYLARMVKKANRLHKLTGKRYHVLQMGSKLEVVNNQIIKAYNKRVSSTKRININTLLNISLYSTE